MALIGLWTIPFLLWCLSGIYINFIWHSSDNPLRATKVPRHIDDRSGGETWTWRAFRVVPAWPQVPGCTHLHTCTCTNLHVLVPTFLCLYHTCTSVFTLTCTHLPVSIQYFNEPLLRGNTSIVHMRNADFLLFLRLVTVSSKLVLSSSWGSFFIIWLYLLFLLFQYIFSRTSFPPLIFLPFTFSYLKASWFCSGSTWQV